MLQMRFSSFFFFCIEMSSESIGVVDQLGEPFWEMEHLICFDVDFTMIILSKQFTSNNTAPTCLNIKVSKPRSLCTLQAELKKATPRR